METKPIAVTVPEAVKLTGIGRASIYRAFSAGTLPRRKAGKRTLILYSDLCAFIESLPVAGGQK